MHAIVNHVYVRIYIYRTTIIMYVHVQPICQATQNGYDYRKKKNVTLHLQETPRDLSFVHL